MPRQSESTRLVVLAVLALVVLALVVLALLLEKLSERTVGIQ